MKSFNILIIGAALLSSVGCAAATPSTQTPEVAKNDADCVSYNQSQRPQWAESAVLPQQNPQWHPQIRQGIASADSAQVNWRPDLPSAEGQTVVSCASPVVHGY